MSNIQDDEWQQVARGKSKAKPSQQISAKKMPKVKNIDSIQTLLNQYDPNDVGEPLHDSSNTKKSSKVNKVAVKQPDPKPEIKKRPKKPPSEPRFSYKSIDEALSKDNFELQEKYEKLQSAFPENTNLRLKEVSHYLNMKISCPEEVVTNFNNKPFDFPLSNVKKNTYKVLKKLYHEEANENLASTLFFQYVSSTTDLIARDIPVWGYRLCIQILAQTYPKAICKSLDQYREKVSSLFNIPNQCLAVLWSVGQLANNNKRFGFQAWLKVMLPNIQIKQVAQYAMSYIEMVFNKTKNPVEEFSSLLHVSDFIEVAKLCYCDNATVKRTTATRDRLRKIFPDFQKMLLRQKSNLRQVFGDLLVQPTDDPGLSAVYCEVLMECLRLDPGCFKVWKDHYASHIPQSKFLLSHLKKQWNVASVKLSQQPFRETIRVFISINTDAESKQKSFTTSEEFKQVKNICTALQSRFETRVSQTRSSFCSRLATIFFGVLALFVSYIVFDLYSHKYVWEKTVTYEFLKSNGILIYVDLVRNKSTHFVQVSVSWLTKNAPIYWKTVSDILGPYLNEFYSYLHSAALYLFNASRPIRLQIAEHGVVALDFVLQYLKMSTVLFLDFVDVVFAYGSLAFVWFVESLKTAYVSAQKLYIGEITWDHIQAAIRSYSTITYDYLVHGLHKIGDYIAPNQP